MLISDVSGVFKTFEINIQAAKPNFSDATIELTVDVNSIDTEIEARDTHLKNADFFDAANYPKMQFKSTKIKKVSTNKYSVNGNLTMDNITKPVTITMKHRGTMLNPHTKKNTADFQFNAKIRRSNFAIGASAPIKRHK